MLKTRLSSLFVCLWSLGAALTGCGGSKADEAPCEGAACLDIACDASLAAPDHGSVSVAGSTPGSVATYTCDEGHLLSHGAERVCKSDGAWSGEAPICVEQCDPAQGGPACADVVCEEALVAPEFGSVSVDGTTYGSVATYACDEGFAISHGQGRVCAADGTWTGVAPTCAYVCNEQVIQDPSFESGSGGGIWEEGSTGTFEQICSQASCGGFGPKSGTHFVWFGGVVGPVASYVEQKVLIPPGHPGHLNFWLRFGGTSTSALTQVRVDGEVLRTFPQPSTEDSAYGEYTVDLSAFADGAEHALRFHFEASGHLSSVYLDDVTLDCEPAVEAP